SFLLSPGFFRLLSLGFLLSACLFGLLPLCFLLAIGFFGLPPLNFFCLFLLGLVAGGPFCLFVCLPVVVCVGCLAAIRLDWLLLLRFRSATSAVRFIWDRPVRTF